METSPVTKFSIGAEVYTRLYSRYQLLTMAAMGSRDSKQWAEDATRRNSMSVAALRLKFLRASLQHVSHDDVAGSSLRLSSKLWIQSFIELHCITLPLFLATRSVI